MKNLDLLKTLIDLFLFFTLLGALALIIAVPLKLVNPDMNIPISIKNTAIVGNDIWTWLVIGMSAIGAFFFVYAIFILRKVLQMFQRSEIFTNDVIKNFKVIGKYIVASAVLTTLPIYFYNIIKESKVEVKYESGGFDSFLLSCSLGLLFIVIAEIFQKAKDLKDENDLTL